MVKRLIQAFIHQFFSIDFLSLCLVINISVYIYPAPPRQT